MKNTPLFDGLIQYIKNKPAAFHTPGHKGYPILSDMLSKLPLDSLYKMDLTEVPGLDDLHCPSGIIDEAQKLLAEAYDADCSFFLVNGSTCGIEALITAVCSPGDKIIIPRNSHKSIINGLIISGAEPVYISPYVDKYWCIPLGISVKDIEYTLINNKGVKAVFLVNPTYHGICGDLGSISNICDNFDIPLLIDEAHGPHLKFNKRLPMDSLEAGASGCVQSPHKLLGSLTQSSWLHIKGGRVDCDRVKSTLQLLQTTSPSYILMASLDCARYQMVLEGEELLDQTLTLARYARDRINHIPGVRCLDENILGNSGVFDYDPTKLVVTCRDAGISGKELERLMREDYNIQPEYSDYSNVTLFVTIGNTMEDMEKLVSAVDNIICKYSKWDNGNSKEKELGILDIPKQVMTPREAFFAEKDTIDILKSPGRISGEIIAPYPPGIPLICPGEEITSEIIGKIRFLKENNISFHGPFDSTLKYIKVIS